MTITTPSGLGGAMPVLGQLLLGPTTSRLLLRATTAGGLALPPMYHCFRDIPTMTDTPAVSMTAESGRVRTLGVVLILVAGLLNFHLPHFLLEAARPSDSASGFLELALLPNVLGAVVAAGGIALGVRWGWLLGILIVGISFVLYLAQETVGLPGLPQNWWEPSRIVALIVEALFVVLARHQIVTSGRRHQPGTR